MTLLATIIEPCCKRIDDLPFPEPAEELRLLNLHVISAILLQHSFQQCEVTLGRTILQMLTIALTDAFPAVKTEAAALVVRIAGETFDLLRMNYKALVKNLLANIFHQHAKVRVVTIKALGLVLAAMQEDYRVIMKDQLVPLLLRLVTDHSAQARLAMTHFCGSVLSEHVGCRLVEEVSLNVELVVALLLLLADDAEDVRSAARTQLERVSRVWGSSLASSMLPHEGVDVEDAEVELRKGIEASEALLESPVEDATKVYLVRHLHQVVAAFASGISGWTTGSRLVYLKGLEQMCHLVGEDMTLALSKVLPHLGSCLLDEEAVARTAAERVCQAMGRYLACATTADVVLPYIAGTLAGLDTAQARCMGLRATLHLLSGHLSSPDLHAAAEIQQLVVDISRCLADLALYEFREVLLRESCLLLTRVVGQMLMPPSVLDDAAREVVEYSLMLALVHLMGRVHGETDSVVAEMALKEGNTLAERCTYKSFSALLDRHFERILSLICPAAQEIERLKRGDLQLAWDTHSVAKSVFEVLLRECPYSAWRLHATTVTILLVTTRPKAKPVHGSPEELALSYASMRGEETAAPSMDIELRLQQLALLEELIRTGSQSWECGAYITAASECILQDILTPNLVWRSGRVEATTRKVALAACYAILKAGATSTETLIRVAPTLVPLLTSSLEDTYSDVSPRFMGCICLTVIFERLRGAFRENSLRELYPMLLKRLDDSNDSVRIAICGTLAAFFLCAPPADYSGTLIDYSLDQLFIHLDDSNAAIQVLF